ncbi:MAG: helix-hairpin-helix domain-containing protein, partial [Cyclobacteriaceae bacterium]
MFVILFSQPVYQFFSDNFSSDLPEDNAYLDSLVSNWNFNPKSEAAPKKEIILFEFDPNMAPREDLLALGFPAYVSDRMINYREKGGQFRQPIDLLKIYGMDSIHFKTVLPFINIPPRPQARSKRNETQNHSTKKEEIFVALDLNSSDTTQLKAIKGIGSVLANRILKFRNSLGGFTNMDQINEVYGLDTTVIRIINKQFFVGTDFIPQQLDINHATEKELASHPYIRSKLAKTIITYRFQHGSFKEIDDLLKIDVIDQQQLTRMRP